MPFFTRAARNYTFIPGAGGNIVIKQYNELGVLLAAETIIDVERYLLLVQYKNVLTTHSGCNGGPHRTRVGHDWRFTLSASVSPGEYADVMLGSHLSVAMRFNIGDPAWWARKGLEDRSYQAESALLESIAVNNDARGTDRVKLEITGAGSSILWGFVGTTPVSAAEWP